MKIKKTNIFNIYRNFSISETRDFKKFLKSPFHNNVKSLHKLFDAIIEKRDLLFTSEFDELIENVSRKLGYSETMMNKQISLLSDVTINYLKVKAAQADIINSEIMLNEYLLRKKNLPVLKKNIEKTNLLIENTDKISEKTFSQYFSNYSHYLDFLTQDIKFTDKANSELRFSILNEALNNFILYSINNLTCLYVNFVSLNIESGNHRQEIFPINLNKIYDEIDIIQKMNKNNKWRYVYRLYKLLFQTYKNSKDIKYYLEYKKDVEKAGEYLEKNLIAFHYNMLINFCVMKERLGEEKDFFKKEGTKLLYLYFCNDIFNPYEDEYLNATTFRNFILSAYSTGDFEMLKSFTEKNHKKLRRISYDDMVNFGMAYYYFGTRKYREAIKCINNIEINKFIYKYDIKNIELRIYYEQNRIGYLTETVKNYREMVLSDELLTKSDKNILLNLLFYLNKLILLRNNTNDKERRIQAGYFRNVVEKESKVATKKWLLEKFSDLSQPKNKLKFK